MMDESGLSSRAKRQKIDKSGRSTALERLKSLKGSKNKCEVGEVDNVYDYIDEKEYSKRVLQRQNEDWLDHPGNGYFEDGREIFDDEYDNEILSDGNQKAPSRKKKHELQKPKNCSKNILEMMANMPEKKKKIEGESNILNLLISDEGNLNLDSQNSQMLSSKEYLKMLSRNSNSKVVPNGKNVTPIMKVSSSDSLAMYINGDSEESNLSQELMNLEENNVLAQPNLSNPLRSISFSKDVNEDSSSSTSVKAFDDELFTNESNNLNTEGEMKISEISSKNQQLDSSVLIDHHEESLVDAKAMLNDEWDFVSQNENISFQSVSIDKSDVPLTVNSNGENVLKFFWWDSYEDSVKQPGVVYLFGKVFHDRKNVFASCCVAVENIERRIFLLPREKRFDLNAGKPTETKVTLLDVYQEFNDKIALSYKIMNFKSRKTTLNYAFDLADVPFESEYLEIKYPFIYNKLPQDLSGETFSRVFGTNTSCLELLLLDRKIKGPCWLEIINPLIPKVQNSWCKLEIRCSRIEDLIISNAVTPPPPMVLMTVNIQSVVNKNMDNEIILIGVLVQNDFKIDKPAPTVPFHSHFCLLARTPNLSWPTGIEEYLSKIKKTEVITHQAEKSLLNHFLTKLFNIDPDVIIGHDLLGFTLDVLIQRIQRLRIPNWSRIGRLKRASIPQFKGKQADKSVTCGRLLCDVVTSAKELIRARNYDLTTLCKQILGLKSITRQDFTSEELKEKFEKDYTIQELITCIMGDASYSLRLIYEMNVLPLSLQITKIAGNIMSKTLLGGRSERNEFLLLHAFTEKNYLVPDKSFIKKPYVVDEGEEIDESAKAAGKKKAQYAGGLVLEPKKGFYDKFVLLMDFNSLYPSIIQEYNICFTTISRSHDEDELNLQRDNQPFGVLPVEIRKLVETRREVKSLMKASNLSPELYMQHNIRQMALKLTANSMYGCLGFPQSRFYAKFLAALVTSKGRDILLNTKSIVEKMNYEVIYGDTDSIMINTNCTNYEEVFIIGNKIKDEVNKLYKYVELEIDGVFKYMLLLKKKKYAAILLSKNSNGEFITTEEYKGLDIVRRDWCQLSSEVGRNVLNQILSDLSPEDRITNVKEHLERISDDLKNRRVPNSLLVVTKQLTKNPNDYNDIKSLPHIQVALRMNAKGEKKFRAGNMVPFVICDNGTNLPPTQRAYHLDELKTNSELLIDVKYYLTQQIHPVVSRICEPVDGIDSAFVADCLGLDPSSYRKAVSKAEKDADTSSVADDALLLNDLEAFKRCEPFMFVCKKENCGTTNFMNEPLRDNIEGLRKCRNPACDASPLEFLTYIANDLTTKLRYYVDRFYQNWMICEDPSCTNRTQRIPMKFSSNFPVCTACHKGIMYREFTSSDLYYQIKFYKYIFTLEKGDSDVPTELMNAYKILNDKITNALGCSAYNSVNMGKLFGRGLRRIKNKRSLQNLFIEMKLQ